MVEAGMPIDIVDQYDFTALSWAALTNQTDVVRYLLKKGANVDKQDRRGVTALHEASACPNNHTDVIRILLQHGARKDIKDNGGNTPIDRARYWKNKEAVDLLEQY